MFPHAHRRRRRAATAKSARCRSASAGEDLPNVVHRHVQGRHRDRPPHLRRRHEAADVTGIRITATAADSDGPAMSCGGRRGTPKDDGTFELKGLTGTRIIRAANLPPGWIVKAVRVNGVDVTDTGVDFKTARSGRRPRGRRSRRKVTEVTGTVTGGERRAGEGLHRRDFLRTTLSSGRVPMHRWVSGRRPDQEGRFQVREPAAGRLYAVAVDYIAQGEWNDPEVLERLKGKGRVHARRRRERDARPQAVDQITDPQSIANQDQLPTPNEFWDLALGLDSVTSPHSKAPSPRRPRRPRPAPAAARRDTRSGRSRRSGRTKTTC